MKIENINRVIRLNERLEQTNKAIEKTGKFLSHYSKDSDGFDSDKNAIYGFNLSEHGDGSGLSVDLTGCMVAISILKFTLAQLGEQKKKIEAEIETL